jgi:hypothetical protein
VFPLPGGESAYVKGTLSNGGKGFHCDETRICGWDFWRADHGTAEMLSAISGTVTEKFVDGVGNPVLVISNTDFETGYMHMDPIIVNIGEKVQSGQKIGMMGDIGQSTWTHLHFWAKNLKTGVFLHNYPSGESVVRRKISLDSMESRPFAPVQKVTVPFDWSSINWPIIGIIIVILVGIIIVLFFVVPRLWPRETIMIADAMIISSQRQRKFPWGIIFSPIMLFSYFMIASESARNGMYAWLFQETANWKWASVAFLGLCYVFVALKPKKGQGCLRGLLTYLFKSMILGVIVIMAFGFQMPEVTIPKIVQAQPPSATSTAKTSSKVLGSSPGIAQWCGLIQKYAKMRGLDPNLVAAIIFIESKGEPEALSSQGAVGLMQVMPSDNAATQQFGSMFADRPTRKELLDPEENISSGTKILSSYIDYTGSARDGLKKYGPMDYGYKYVDLVMGAYETHDFCGTK